MLESFANIFGLFEDLFSRESAIWMVITSLLAILLAGLRATGTPDSVTKKVGEDKWITVKFR